MHSYMVILITKVLSSYNAEIECQIILLSYYNVWLTDAKWDTILAPY